jgi:1,2-dihydroxy-3-keto-5-methylthiopentene dioxygenase
MSRLRVFLEEDAANPVLVTEDGKLIKATLHDIGVRFERWPTRGHGEDILAAYAPEIAALKIEGGYQTVDVVSITPDHPDRSAMRTKFLSEHIHAEDEVRFFVGGEGLFTLHHDGRVFDVLCTKGDLMSVPAGMNHWFDMGPTPRFTAIRLFVNPDGWVAAFTGNDISDRFPRHETA